MPAPAGAHTGAAPINSGKARAAGRFAGRNARIVRILAAMARTVAIVEDDAAIRANYADILKKHGYQVSA